MSKSIHPNLTADLRAERRARRQPRPTERRQGTLSAVIAADLRNATSLDDLGLTYPLFDQWNG